MRLPTPLASVYNITLKDKLTVLIIQLLLGILLVASISFLLGTTLVPTSNGKWAGSSSSLPAVITYI